jgi:glutamine phosphoribosylpyrophosphate amidotransferase
MNSVASSERRLYCAAWGTDGRIAYVRQPNGLRPLRMDSRRAHLIEWGAESSGTELLAAAILRDLRPEQAESEAGRRSIAQLLAAMPSEGFALSAEALVRVIENNDGREPDQVRASWG